MTSTDLSAPVLDRIDVLWSVHVRADCTVLGGTLSVAASFMLTLGAYAGPMTVEAMAENINSRGIEEGDIDETRGFANLTTAEVATTFKERGIMPEDIVSMSIISVMLDDKSIAASYNFD